MGRDYGEHGRCEAKSKTTGERCKQPATDSRGKCHYHGGATPIEHGFYSDLMDDEDKALIEELEQMSTAKKLEDTLNLQLMKLRRAVEQAEGTDQQSFFAAFADLLGKVEEPEETDLRALAQMLGTNDRAIREWMDLIRKTAKDLHKISPADEEAPGWGDVDDGQLEDIKDLVDDAY